MLRMGKWSLMVAVGLVALVAGVDCCADEGAGKQSQDLFTVLERFHGHTCGGSLMGARLGLAARAALERAGVEGKLQAQYYNSLSCPVDGIQVMAGTTYGNRALEVQDCGEHRLVLSDEKSGRQVEARITTGAMEKAGASREMAKKARALPVGSPERKKLEQEIETIFAWLKTAPETEVVTVKPLR